MLKLAAQKRDIFGKALKAPRQAGQLPVVVYGPKTETHNYFVDAKLFGKVFREAGESTIVTLESPEGQQDVLIKEVAFHPTSGQPIHADFYIIDKTKKLEVNVPLVFEGEAPAVKEFAGIVVKVMHELPVEALPKDLPHDLKVNLELLTTLESQILVKDLIIPPGVDVKANPDEVVAAVTVAKEEPEEPAAPIDLEAIEVEKKGKKEEEDEAEPAA